MTDAVPAPPDVEPDRVVDNRGTSCANGIASVQRALTDLDDGEVLLIRSTDRRARIEYPKLAERTAHELLGIRTERRGLFGKQHETYLRIHHDHAD